MILRFAAVNKKNNALRMIFFYTNVSYNDTPIIFFEYDSNFL